MYRCGGQWLGADSHVTCPPWCFIMYDVYSVVTDTWSHDHWYGVVSTSAGTAGSTLYGSEGRSSDLRHKSSQYSLMHGHTSLCLGLGVGTLPVSLLGHWLSLNVGLSVPSLTLASVSWDGVSVSRLYYQRASVVRDNDPRISIIRCTLLWYS